MSVELIVRTEFHGVDPVQFRAEITPVGHIE